ncbi:MULTISPECIES: hypothetical protein [unclassified Mesorhizobium]|uniref:hypothetical protein n=1 Tax=unclassified Mesorhizobium TaxID=325217 RepID=UPI000FCB983F|nr:MULTISPECIES: hypothetical protein [unclassified Mesorhizobium]TGU07850.1 hypothetical protein EN806_31390 [bacterium M00.F.Ca.ET.163.01.1.1]TGU47056.1 hypothetical protein EN789_13565 [bacterium M00.F.Ca.ET.146.01.1.1]TGW12716.1 hypothetical protein EN788_08140 [Mesorhizobium sp. M2D.F.Ca.ET.145.01.1.1]TGP33334.1 hypothetical protein EN875_015440 [Mesorhizobium sp. M2D.F.Ca.ET.232.01.1.1]TGP59368.1 hypothetical protein EN869_013900 [Mesorhizobium sp. M2D.F.Ca.ET.226.01.1.1]
MFDDEMLDRMSLFLLAWRRYLGHDHHHVDYRAALMKRYRITRDTADAALDALRNPSQRAA